MTSSCQLVMPEFPRLVSSRHVGPCIICMGRTAFLLFQKMLLPAARHLDNCHMKLLLLSQKEEASYVAGELANALSAPYFFLPFPPLRRKLTGAVDK